MPPKKQASKKLRDETASELILFMENTAGWYFFLVGPFYDYFADKRSKGTYDPKKAVVYLRNNYVRPGKRHYKREITKGWSKADFEYMPHVDMSNLTEADENGIAQYFLRYLLDGVELKKVRKGSAWKPYVKLDDYKRREIAKVRR